MGNTYDKNCFEKASSRAAIAGCRTTPSLAQGVDVHACFFCCLVEKVEKSHIEQMSSDDLLGMTDGRAL
jgi:hypothetical protein